MIATVVARRVVTVRPDPVRVAAARLDRVGESLRAMSVTAGGSLTGAAPEIGVESITTVCDAAAAASRIRLAGLGDWSASLADRLRQAVQLYADTDATTAKAVSEPPNFLPAPMPAQAMPAHPVPTDPAPAAAASPELWSAGLAAVGLAPSDATPTTPTAASPELSSAGSCPDGTA